MYGGWRWHGVVVVQRTGGRHVKVTDVLVGSAKLGGAEGEVRTAC
jgi:hypothetical protein